jgi:outer membrane protein OmpU
VGATAGSGVVTSSAGVGKLNGQGWTVGAAYEFGPYKIGLDYETGTNNATSEGGVSRLDQAALSGTYVLGPGIRLVGGIFAYDWDQENSISKNSGIGGATGLKLAF